MGVNKVSLKEYNVYVSLVKQINIVVPAFIPNFKLKILDLGDEIFSNGENGKRIEFMSVVNGADIPLIAESNGVKKIVNLCSAIIYMYNNPSAILVIDEFDSGVFEYLFGQILDILSKFAKGQLLFTSHNLRPLEFLDTSDVYISTSNKDNRYITLKNVKTTNNLRDFYIRSLQVGGQKEEIYNETEESSIALALRRGLVKDEK